MTEAQKKQRYERRQFLSRICVMFKSRMIFTMDTT
ncbi:hypothetical protein RvY_13393 [Ramazzottius varieornatus]|uniref:Uncharacterized protein n=1 Tax=Ramazzottius varieornatus TaxID=947166 RepID=A0A1D1VPW0_RAMVA|nr:hypothetical protein RvY_13393 [Ramazzottius varieornatus]